MSATKEQIRQIIADNNLNSVADVYSLLKDSFKDMLRNSFKYVNYSDLKKFSSDFKSGLLLFVGIPQHPDNISHQID